MYDIYPIEYHRYNIFAMKKNLVYFGSPQFSAEILESLLTNPEINLVGIVTQKDKPVGRKQIITPSPVSQTAEKHQLPTFKPDRLDDANLAHIKLLKPDIFLVVSYGKIIPQSWLDCPKVGTFNVHFSLLPKYRGALCISEAIKNQDKETGVTLMEMDSKLDHGNIISQSSITIDTHDDYATLSTKLTQEAIKIIERKLPEICAQKYHSLPQDESLATYTPLHKNITRQDSYIPLTTLLKATDGIGSSETYALIRSLSPEPGAWTTVQGKDLKIISCTLIDRKLVLNQVQLSGKQPISWKQFSAGYKSTFKA